MSIKKAYRILYGEMAMRLRLSFTYTALILDSISSLGSNMVAASYTFFSFLKSSIDWRVDYHYLVESLVIILGKRRTIIIYLPLFIKRLALLDLSPRRLRKRAN
jgi:hypothetical protein